MSSFFQITCFSIGTTIRHVKSTLHLTKLLPLLFIVDFHGGTGNAMLIIFMIVSETFQVILFIEQP